MAKRKAPVDKSKWTMDQLLSQYKNPYTNELSVREMLANAIRTSCKDYNGKDFTTNLDSLYFLTHGRTKEEVSNELSKWISLKGVDLQTPIVLPERFFNQ